MVHDIVCDDDIGLLHHLVVPDPVLLKSLVFSTVIIIDHIQETACNTTSSPQKSLRSNK